MTEKQKDVARNILIALSIVGVVSTLAIAPGLIKVLPLLGKINIRRINQEIKRLHKRGLIEYIKHKNGIVSIRLTAAGREKIRSYEMDNLMIDKPKEWDGRWRVTIFDIPVTKNSSRELLRRKMKKLGFYKLQKSVFAYPYPCLEVVHYLRDYLGVKGDVEYLEADRLESQDKLIKYFFT
jgi:phenylacetic acid degradation operon negative regulatory protein